MKKTFECIRCGKCCLHCTPEFTEEEMKNVMQEAKFMKIDFVECEDKGKKYYYTRRNLEAYMRILMLLKIGAKYKKEDIINNTCPEYPCEFYSKEHKKCLIYDKRPHVCRYFGDRKEELFKCLNL